MTEMNIKQILEYLPHRYPFLLLDRVLDLQPNKSIHALKNVTINEPFFSGHFPGEPVMPGVLITEAMAQASGILTYVTFGTSPKSGELYYFAGIDGARFKKVVRPGDQLELFIEILRMRTNFAKFQGTATVNKEVVCVAELMCAKIGKEA